MERIASGVGGHELVLNVCLDDLDDRRFHGNQW